MKQSEYQKDNLRKFKQKLLKNDKPVKMCNLIINKHKSRKEKWRYRKYKSTE